MDAVAVSDVEAQDYLLLGLRNRWWPITASRFVVAGQQPVGMVRLGEKIVVWRDQAGGIHVQQDRCPHRAVQLSRGLNLGDRLRCNYHGVEVGADGTAANAPTAVLMAQKLFDLAELRSAA